MQNIVNEFQAKGVVGELASNALFSGKGYILQGTGATAAVAASGTVTITTGQNVSAGDTVTVGGVVYTAVASGATGNQFDVGADADASAANIAAVIGGIATATADDNVVTITASIAGVVGNSITLGASGTNLTASGANLSGGADYVASNNATIGRAFTRVANSDNTVVMGGTGAYAGILILPKNQAIFNNLTATLTVPDGSVGSIMQSGYIYESLSTASNAGDSIYFVKATGALGAGTASTGQTQIKGAQVIEGGAAGAVVVIGVIPQV